MKKTALLIVALTVCLTGYAQMDTARQPAAQTPAEKRENGKSFTWYWLLISSIIGAGIGGAAVKLLAARIKEHDEQQPAPGHGGDGGFVEARKAEQEQAKLLSYSDKLQSENERLRRENAELDRLLTAAKTESMKPPGKEMVFYMPQPSMNGRFQEASKSPDEAHALYAFRLEEHNHEVASFEFIAKGAYLNAAIGNEPSWIAVACDRTNQPSGTTSRVRTDSPGEAILKNGEWEITRKARITYI